MSGFISLLVLAALAVPVALIIALARLGQLGRRLSALERSVADLRAHPSTPAPAIQPQATPPASAVPATASPRPTPDRPVAPPASLSPHPPSQWPPPSSAPLPPKQRVATGAPRLAPSDAIARGVRWLRRWFSEGNVPVKVGMLVLFAGVAALLKYAGDQGWMTLPIELRLAGVALAALAGVAFGWKQRHARRSFALALQGGAIGVLLLVVFAAFKLYPLLPPTAAFALSVVLVAGVGVLAVAQNAIALAWLGILAGFLAPLWLSTGQGSHVALFGYYAVLNAGIFAIAWHRSWRALNVLGFVFTFAIGTLWGVLRYRPEDFATTQPFLALFFAFYLLVPVLNARVRHQRSPGARRAVLDGCLVFGTPLVAFALQAGLLEGERMPLAFCALGLATLYAALARSLRGREQFASLIAPFAILAVGFATLAVPLALSAHATASIFALEGAALVWLGLRQLSRWQQWVGTGLQLAAAWGFALGVGHGIDVPLANSHYMSGLLIALAGWASAWSHRRSGVREIATAFYLWGLMWWLGIGLYEIDRFVDGRVTPDVMLMLALLTGALAVTIHRRLPWRALVWTATLALVSALPLAWLQDAAHGHPLAGTGWVAWLGFALAGWWILRGLHDWQGRATGVAHVAWMLAWPLLASMSLHHIAERLALGGGWMAAMIALPWIAAAAMLQWRADWVARPLSARFEAWRPHLQTLFAAILALGWLRALWLSGDSAPLPWMPILNPLDLAQWAILAVIAAWLASARAPAGLADRRGPLLAFAAFALISAITLRACHHWGATQWDGTMFSTSLVQTSLTVVWSLLGVMGWMIGSRRGRRTLWLAGAVLMAVVLAKLLLVDRQHLGNLLGIVSFIAYGLLCTVVGYVAPAPPRPDVQPAAPTGAAA